MKVTIMNMNHKQLTNEFGPRLVTLCTGQAGLRGALPVEIQIPQPEPAAPGAPAEPAPVIDFWASDATLDRSQEVIAAAGWQLDNYRRNPVFQNAHNYSNIFFTLGRALITEVRGERLFQRVLFATGINPMARLAYDMYRAGFLNAVSVGFLPLRWENGTDKTPWRRRHLQQELLELSAVSVPANPNALALALKAGAIEKSDLRDLHDLLQAMTTGDVPATCAALKQKFCGSDADQVELLQLARRVADAMRHL